jgi:DNA-binding transcriptional LysR family regulator
MRQVVIICYVLIQMLDLLETAEIEAFVRTVEAGSLSRAAKELGIPRATLGRRLARLEERLGTRLLRRTTRSIRVTPSGEALLRHARVALGAVRDAVEAVRQSDGVVRGLIRFAALPMGDGLLDAHLVKFVERHPEVQLHVNVAARFVSFAEVDFDVALRAGETSEQGLVSRRVLRTSSLAFASPAYLAAHGIPKRIEDLASHRCLLGFQRGSDPQHYWPLLGGGTVRVDGTLVSNDIHLLRRAVEQGLGIALLPLLIAGDALAKGTAVPVLDEVIGGETQLAVVYPEKAFQSPVVRVFIDELIAWAKATFGPRHWLWQDRKTEKAAPPAKGPRGRRKAP